MVFLKSLAFAVLASFAALPALAEDLPTLTVYTYDSFASDYGHSDMAIDGFGGHESGYGFQMRRRQLH